MRPRGRSYVRSSPKLGPVSREVPALGKFHGRTELYCPMAVRPWCSLTEELTNKPSLVYQLGSMSASGASKRLPMPCAWLRWRRQLRAYHCCAAMAFTLETWGLEALRYKHIERRVAAQKSACGCLSSQIQP